MSKNFTINIPTKPYLAKYIASRYGHPVMLNNNTLLGIVVLSLLQKKVCTHLNLRDQHLQFRTFTTQITFLAPWRYMSHFGVDLSDDQIIQLNRAWDSQFDEELYYHCLRSINHASRYKGYNEAIEQFAENHGIIIGVDTTFECLKKTEYRFRRTLEENLSRNVLSIQDCKIQQEKKLSRNVPSKNVTNPPSLFD
ncbi:hypothetical protein FAM09_24745 [Niastella caeni]|uniref:Uncharacterized protein n=1 Tax=Niastella caeni TaxID=2569763 RepID=A0A4S8HGF4_9BACT|nr:hypothetical protein [Niastella caeni]THU34230.1 hypothetical protein FAM09_24745 [Niastella caeni]